MTFDTSWRGTGVAIDGLASHGGPSCDPGATGASGEVQGAVADGRESYGAGWPRGESRVIGMMARGLSRRRVRHLLVTGAPGVGKTTLVREFARCVGAGEVPFLAGRRVAFVDCRDVAPEESRRRFGELLEEFGGEDGHEVVLCLDGLGNLLRSVEGTTNKHLLRRVLSATDAACRWASRGSTQPTSVSPLPSGEGLGVRGTAFGSRPHPRPLSRAERGEECAGDESAEDVGWVERSEAHHSVGQRISQGSSDPAASEISNRGHDVPPSAPPLLPLAKGGSAGGVQIIGILTDREFDELLSGEAGILELCTRIEVPEPDEDSALAIVRDAARRLETEFGVRIEEKGVEKAVTLSAKFIWNQRLPLKAIRVLERACEDVVFDSRRETASEGRGGEGEVGRGGEDEMGDTGCATVSLLPSADVATAGDDRPAYPSSHCLPLSLSPCLRSSSDGSLGTVRVEHVIRAVADITRVPVETLSGDIDDTDYEQILGAAVVGQQQAVEAVAMELSLIKAGITDPGKPASVMLFCGLNGVGKTELAKKLAEIYSATKRLQTFTMGNFVESHAVSGIIGVPAGYVGQSLTTPTVLLAAVRQSLTTRPRWAGASGAR